MAQRAAPPRLGPDAWLAAHVGWLILAVVFVGFGLRLWTALLMRFNGDEALHYELFHRGSAGLVYEASKTNAHPPLYFLSLYYWHLAGSSELWLRLPAVLFGSGAIWLLARWATLAFDARAGVVVAILVATAPGLVDVSAEVRGYGMLLFGIAGTLLYLQRALAGSPRALVGYAAFFCLAILTHYSMVWVTAALGLYALVVILRQRPQRRFVIGWAVIQAAAAALYAFLWFTHLRHLHGGGLEKEAIGSWLAQSYLGENGHSLASILDFAWANTARIFVWLAVPVGAVSGHLALGGALAGLAALGVVAWVWQRKLELTLLLVLAPVVACGAGLLNLFPYGGSRHSTFLAPFLIAALALPLAWLGRWRLWAMWFAALACGGAWTLAADTPGRQGHRSQLTHGAMTDALAYLRTHARPGSTILCDMQTLAMLRYYLDRDSLGEHIGFPSTETGFMEQQIGGYRTLTPFVWSFPPAEFEAQLDKAAAAYRMPRGTPIWVVDARMDRTLLLGLGDALRRRPFPYTRVFDHFLSVFQAQAP